MKISKNCCLIIFTALICTSPSSYADREGSIRTLFTWGEANYSNFFSPSPAPIQKITSWTYVYYPTTNTYIGVDDKDLVWVLGDMFGGLLYIDTLDVMLDKIGYTETNPDIVNSLVPLTPDPTTNAFLVKQETSWFVNTYTPNFSIYKSLSLKPDGFGLISIIPSKSGVLTSELYLPNPEWHSIQEGYFYVIAYHIEIRGNEEYIVFNKTGNHTTLLVNDETSANGQILQEFHTEPGPQKESLLFNGRENVFFKFFPNGSEEVIVKD